MHCVHQCPELRFLGNKSLPGAQGEIREIYCGSRGGWGPGRGGGSPGWRMQCAARGPLQVIAEHKSVLGAALEQKHKHQPPQTTNAGRGRGSLQPVQPHADCKHRSADTKGGGVGGGKEGCFWVLRGGTVARTPWGIVWEDTGVPAAPPHLRHLAPLKHLGCHYSRRGDCPLFKSHVIVFLSLPSNMSALTSVAPPRYRALPAAHLSPGERERVTPPRLPPSPGSECRSSLGSHLQATRRRAALRSGR